jgi:hypothetical protein
VTRRKRSDSAISSFFKDLWPSLFAQPAKQRHAKSTGICRPESSNVIKKLAKSIVAVACYGCSVKSLTEDTEASVISKPKKWATQQRSDNA